MKRQRNSSKLKEQEESPERTNNETELTDLLNPKFKKVVINVPTELWKITDRNADHYNKELETIKMNQSKTDNSIADIKMYLESKNSRLTDKEEWINDMEDRIMEITQSEQQTERQILKNESNIWDLCDNIKHMPTYV